VRVNTGRSDDVTQSLVEVPSTVNRTTKSLGVFGDNHGKPFHRWYPFVEGYSAELVRLALDDLSPGDVVLDPFGGSGTTALEAALAGVDSIFCEVNPYLAWVADVKVNQSRRAAHTDAAHRLRAFARALERGRRQGRPPGDHPLIAADGRRDFFPPGVAAQAVTLLARAARECPPEASAFARLAVTTSLIPASNMIRRTDLRRRRAGDPAARPLLPLVAERLRMMADDLVVAGGAIAGSTTRIAADARSIPETASSVGLVVTSPPYLNGTNYCRNTKLELLALGLVESDEGFADLRAESIAAGINNVSRRRPQPESIPPVEAVASVLDEVAYDRRIPTMVRMYFSDLREVFRCVRHLVLPGTRWLLDIGDSRFSGVHVPTHDLLCAVASLEGWRVKDTSTIRSRRSYDGSSLTQVLIDFRALP
jgi:hypothetical protein